MLQPGGCGPSFLIFSSSEQPWRPSLRYSPLRLASGQALPHIDIPTLWETDFTGLFGKLVPQSVKSSPAWVCGLAPTGTFPMIQINPTGGAKTQTVRLAERGIGQLQKHGLAYHWGQIDLVIGDLKGIRIGEHQLIQLAHRDIHTRPNWRQTPPTFPLENNSDMSVDNDPVRQTFTVQNDRYLSPWHQARIVNVYDVGQHKNLYIFGRTGTPQHLEGIDQKWVSHPPEVLS